MGDGGRPGSITGPVPLGQWRSPRALCPSGQWAHQPCQPRGAVVMSSRRSCTGEISCSWKERRPRKWKSTAFCPSQSHPEAQPAPPPRPPSVAAATSASSSTSFYCLFAVCESISSSVSSLSVLRRPHVHPCLISFSPWSLCSEPAEITPRLQQQTFPKDPPR